MKGYCVEDGDEESDEKVVLTEGDQILILNLCFKDCVKIYFPEGTKTLSIPSDCECKYEIMSAICHFDNVNKITVPDIIKNKSFSGRLRVIHDFTHPHVGTIHCGTIISVVKYDVKTSYPCSITLISSILSTQISLSIGRVQDFQVSMNHQH